MTTPRPPPDQGAQKIRERTSSRTPHTIRITPTVCSEMPETEAVIAHLRIAPTALNRTDVPTPISQPLPLEGPYRDTLPPRPGQRPLWPGVPAGASRT